MPQNSKMFNPRPDLIATRTLKYVGPTGDCGYVEIEITMPVQNQDSKDWSCFLRLIGPTKSADRTIIGADSLQCLILVIAALRVRLRYFQKKGFKFSWLGIEGVGFEN